MPQRQHCPLQYILPFSVSHIHLHVYASIFGKETNLTRKKQWKPLKGKRENEEKT
jgi:hypothetical protein